MKRKVLVAVGDPVYSQHAVRYIAVAVGGGYGPDLYAVQCPARGSGALRRSGQKRP